MQSFFGIDAIDFIYVWAVFGTTMAAFFGLRQKHVWLSYFMTATFILICLTLILFRQGLSVRLFGALMLVSVVVIEVVVTRMRKRQAPGKLETTDTATP